MSEKEKSSSASQSDGWEQTQTVNIHCIDRNDKILHFQEVTSKQTSCIVTPYLRLMSQSSQN